MNTCPKCGETQNFHYNYDYSKAHRPVVDILCKNCGELFLCILNLPKEEPKQQTLKEAAKQYAKLSTVWHAEPVFIDGAKWQAEQANTSNPAEQLIRGLRVLSQTFTHNELESILEQLYYVKSQEKLEYYFDQIRLNATAADIESAFQYGYFDTLTAMGKN
jgi:hypothetical protein